MRLRPSRRGQNMVLLALTMLFLALMVTMTIGLGLRIRQKHELQNLADAAAYSNAVMTARTFNNMAAVNRLEVSYWVAQSADQSLISWTAYAHAMANAAHNGAMALALLPSCSPALTQARKREVGKFAKEVRTYILTDIRGPRGGPWLDADRAAGRESLRIQGDVGALREELYAMRNTFYDRVKSQQLSRQIVAISQQDDISVVDSPPVNGKPTGAAGVSMRGVDCDFSEPGPVRLDGPEPSGSGLCLRATWTTNMLYAAMGTRGHDFLTGRPQIPSKVAQRLTQIAARYPVVSLVIGGKGGSAYWDRGMSHGAIPSSTARAWGDDHGSVTVSAAGCSQNVPVSAFVMSTDLDDRADRHDWSPHLAGDVELQEDLFHTMGDCKPYCPSVWVQTVGFQPKESEAEVWGQPKAIVALKRDLRMKTFPWELHFSFPFSATGQASEWDGRGHKLHTRVGKGTSISQQAAVATGIAYYHRSDHWDEFPNLLNPFWRATLAPIDVDDRLQDLGSALAGDEHRWQRDAFRALSNAGYKGLH